MSIEDGDLVLEPSAGVGLLADGIKRAHPNAYVHCVELNAKCNEELVAKGHNVVGHDFFLFTPKFLYDKVIACPNFRDNVDVNHIMKMYDCVKPGGWIVSLTSPLWMTGNSPRQVEFRAWLADKEYDVTMLPDNSFMEDGMTVPTAIITICK